MRDRKTIQLLCLLGAVRGLVGLTQIGAVLGAQDALLAALDPQIGVTTIGRPNLARACVAVAGLYLRYTVSKRVAKLSGMTTLATRSASVSPDTMKLK